MNADRSLAAISAANRFGLGAGPGDAGGLDDPSAWLLQQTGAAPLETQALAGLPASYDYLRREADFRARRKQLKDDGAAGKNADSAVNPLRQLYLESFGEDLRREYLARWQIAAQTDTPFAERLVRFWSNHFAVSTDKVAAALYAAPLEREAIRPRVNGRFVDLLLAVETHPAMLRYLDQAQSIGPDSGAARLLGLREMFTFDGEPARKYGLNENLAREILELHTLGAGSAYTQADVTEFARSLTGWSMPAPRQIERGKTFDSAFLYRENAHEPGSRSILGKRYPDDGQDQARAVLADLAIHPATAQHLALKLARHFVADEPPPALVQRMARAYLDSSGHLPAIYQAMVLAPESWQPAARKFRTPQDFVVAGIRGGSVAVGDRPRAWEGVLARMGQPTFQPRSPAGYTDVAADWIAADAVWKRLQVAEALGERVPRQDLDPVSRARAALGPHLDAQTEKALLRAEAPQQAMAILFASPAFQWRA